MSSLQDGFEYDVFISYRQNDNRSGWVSAFVEHLREELASIIKDPVNIYFDENPHDGLQDTHQVDKSLEGKLRCVIFLPILSRTYCDPKSFAWAHEFITFRDFAVSDRLGMHVQLESSNITSRILPVQIHELDARDKALFEQESLGTLRSIDLVFKSPGVNRPLTPTDTRTENLNKVVYRDQINKTAHAIAEILSAQAISKAEIPEGASSKSSTPPPTAKSSWIWREVLRRNTFRAGLTYIAASLLIRQLLIVLVPVFQFEENTVHLVVWLLIGFFPLAMAAAWIFEYSPDGLIRTTSDKSATNPYPPSKKKPLTSSVIIITLLILLAGQYVYFNWSKDGAASSMGVAMDKSIAVLPFENRSENKEDEYLADGITEDIINQLSIMGELRVVNRGSVQKYKGQGSSYKAIASDLQVKTLLTGSIQRNGNAIRVTVQLIDGSTNRYLWGNTFHRRTSDVNEFQSEIAPIIGSFLKVSLNDLEKERLGRRPTSNASAYDYYLKGRSHYYLYDHKSNEQAIEKFKTAISLDPSYAIAWAGLGDAYSQVYRFGGDISWVDSSVVAASKAIKLDSNLSEGYKALANAYNYKKQYKKAFPLLLKAVQLSPTNSQAVGNLGTTYFLMGDFPEALRWQKKSAGLNPGNWIPYQIAGLIYQLLGDLKNAESWLKKSLELNARYGHTYEVLGYVYVGMGKPNEALKLVPNVLAIDSQDTRVLEEAGLIAHFAGDPAKAKIYFRKSIKNNESYNSDLETVSPIGLGQILLLEGNNVEADVHLSHALEINLEEIKNGSQDDEIPFRIAAIYAIRGQREKSLLWLQKAIDANWIDYIQFVNGPWFANYKSDQAFLDKINRVRQKVDAMHKRVVQD